MQSDSKSNLDISEAVLKSAIEGGCVRAASKPIPDTHIHTYTQMFIYIYVYIFNAFHMHADDKKERERFSRKKQEK